MPSITFGNALQNYFTNRFRRHSAARKKHIDALKNKADAEKYIFSVRKKIRSILQFPREKSPLLPQITGKLTFPGGIIEKVLFRSRPGFTVSANFYLPDAPVVSPLPAILYLCGHAHNGKSSTMYQKFCRSLAKRGFAVLIVDPIGQGERKQFDPQYPPTRQHNIMGKQLHLTGETLFSWRIYDAVRSMDYLLERPEVDPLRIGICGESGGGTLTTWMAAVEDRAAWIVPSSVATTWLRNVENEVAVDTEQIPPGAAAMGLEFADFLIAAAPKPMLLLGGKRDFFDPRGFAEIEAELRKIYTLLGKAEALDYMIGEDHHGIYQPLREKGYEFLCHCAGVPNFCTEEGEVPVCTEEELYAAPDGRVLALPCERKFHEYTAERCRKLKVKRKALPLELLRLRLKKLMGIKEITAPEYRKLSYRYYTSKGEFQNYTRFGLETESGEVMCVLHRSAKKALFYLFEQISGETCLYIPHEDSVSELDLREPPPGDALYSLDCRGVGECISTACDQMPELDLYYYYGVNYHFPALHLLWGEDMCGKRVMDILGALELIAPVSSTGKVVLEAKGHGCIYALLTAVISPFVSELRLEGLPCSWGEIASIHCPKDEDSPLSILPRNILSVTDIPEIIETLKKAGMKISVS